MRGGPPPSSSLRLQEGTKRRALLVLLLICFLVALVAHFWPDHRARTQVETYLRQGLRGAEALMKRDIDRLSPLGEDPGPAVQHLGALGLTCAAPAALTGEWRCTMRRPGQDRMMIAIEAVLRIEDGRVVQTRTSFSESPR